ncbi:MAG TPA: heat-inducible transcriptional repressor HrcA, partial [Parvularcula sp.]|nr:heat-inducible transcriptional repressor HrcA [Parvularcula sp.]
ATSPGQALAVLVFEDGRVENRVMKTPPGLTLSGVTAAGNYLAARLKGRTIGETREAILKEIEQNKAALDELTARLVADGVAEISSAERTSLIVRGRGRLLDDGAGADLERVRMLFDDLERKRDVIEVLSAARDAEG